MKRILQISFLLLLSCAISYGQSTQYPDQKDFIPVNPANTVFGQEDGMKLDSFTVAIPWVNNEELVKSAYGFVYDTNGNTLRGNWWVLDFSSSKFEYFDKQEMSYDSLNRFVEKIYYGMRKDSLVLDAKYLRRFDAKGDFIESEFYDYLPSKGEWKLIWRHSYEYNDRHLRIRGDEKKPDNNGSLKITRKFEYEYDVSGNETAFIQYEKLGGSWKATYKAEYAYDTDGNEVLRQYSYYDVAKKDLLYDSKIVKKYEQGHKVLQEEYSYEGNDWGIDQKIAYSNDSDGRLKISDYMKWDATRFKWYTYARYEKEYDNAGNIISDVFYNGGTVNSSFKPESKKTYEFDNSFERNRLIYPNKEYNRFTSFYFGDAHKLDVFKNYQWDASSQEWMLEEIYRFFYSKAPVPMSTQRIAHPRGLRVFPTLVRDFLTVEGMEEHGIGQVNLDVFDEKGVFLLHKKLRLSEYVLLQGLPAGTYIYRLSSNLGVYSGKFVKQ